jgi:hypothetical protein
MKLAITHSKKVPGIEDYSSEGFSCTLEVEVPEEAGRDAKAVQAWLKELYAQAKASVEEQVKSVPRRSGNGNGSSAAGIFTRPGNGPSADRPAPGGNGGRTASPKQISFPVSLGARNKLTFADLQRLAQERFRVEDLYQLDRNAASALIDELKGEGAQR